MRPGGSAVNPGGTRARGNAVYPGRPATGASCGAVLRNQRISSAYFAQPMTWIQSGISQPQAKSVTQYRLFCIEFSWSGVSTGLPNNTSGGLASTSSLSTAIGGVAEAERNGRRREHDNTLPWGQTEVKR